MKLVLNLKKILQMIFIVIFAALVVLLVYYGSIPNRYDLSPGSVSDVDIISPRSITDDVETEALANEQMNMVNPVYVRSDDVSEQCITDLTAFFVLCNDIRDESINDDGTYANTYRAMSDALISQTSQKFGIELTDDESFQLMTCDASLLDYIQSKSISVTSLILTDMVDDTALADEIIEYTEDVEESDTQLYMSNTAIIQSLLTRFVKPNAVYDEAATLTAKQKKYDEVMASPILIEKGTRIVVVGDVITQNTYNILLDLDLIQTNQFDTTLLIGIAVYMLIIFSILALYLNRFEQDMIKNPRDVIAIALSFFLPILAAVYLSGISTQISPVYFTAVIIATYLGVQSGIILSFLQILIILPIYQYDQTFIFVSIVGAFICSMIAGQRNHKYNSASLILLTSLSCFVAAVGLNLVLKSSKTELFTSSLWAIISGSVAVIAATGFMPIFELLSNTVSPIRLIDLSQPGNPLLKRLFVEAPGTSQHSMMVANLADSAAEFIGANALLAKVGAYYHDIGKLDKPMYFTENQQNGINPHDELTPEESASIITSHPDLGVRLGRKYRLPSSIIKIIQEHHGTTFQAYFYHKAKAIAAENNMPDPPINTFKYRCSIPSSKESAVVMLADTCEAAIKSTGITSLDEAEELFRKLIKQKIDQDQLTNSCLSFHDIELIIRSFVQVYSGVFHERIKYPDDSTVRK